MFGLVLRLSALVALLICTPPAFAADDTTFDGTWEGVIHFDKEAFLATTSTPAEGVKFKLDIRDVVVRVYITEKGNLVEVKPGLFHIAAVGGNAVVFATEAASNGAWVESWVFAITHKNNHALLAEYSRLVNNLQTPETDPQSKFATRGEGELQQTAP